MSSNKSHAKIRNMDNINPETDQTPNHHFLLKGRVLGLLTVLTLTLICIDFLSPAPAPATASDLSPGNILSAVNRERSLRNLITLNTHSKLVSAAEFKAQDMIDRNYFAHVDPDGNYIWNKIASEGYTPYSQLGENLAIEFYDTESLVAAWMNSPTHRANILQENFRDQGMGVSYGNASLGQYSSSIVNTFGTLVVNKPSANVAQNKPVAPAAAPAPAPTKIPTPTPAAVSTPTPTPIATATPPTSPSPTPQISTTTSQTGFGPRDAGVVAEKTVDTSQPNPELARPQTENITPTPSTKPRQTNRYVTLTFGLVLLLFLIVDVKSSADQKSSITHKKINNVVMLLISLVVVAFMYWL